MGAVGKREPPVKKFICKYCKVPVISKTNTRAKYGYEHKRHCRRRNQM